MSLLVPTLKPGDTLLYQWGSSCWRPAEPPDALHTGYGNRNPERLFDTLASDYSLLAPLICDIRIAPFSKREDWNRDALEAKFNPPGKRRLYCHIPQLGNPNRFECSDKLAVADMTAGIAELERIFKAGRTPIILCACAKHAECHRSLITGELEKRGRTVQRLWWKEE